jgi:hypothetical protein
MGLIKFANAWIPARCIMSITVEKHQYWFRTAYRTTARYSPQCVCNGVVGHYQEFKNQADAEAAANQLADTLEKHKNIKKWSK